jgi:hypothetical protein
VLNRVKGSQVARQTGRRVGDDNVNQRELSAREFRERNGAIDCPCRMVGSVNRRYDVFEHALPSLEIRLVEPFPHRVPVTLPLVLATRQFASAKLTSNAASPWMLGGESFVKIK